MRRAIDGIDNKDSFTDDNFAAIPLQRRKDIKDEVHKKYIAQLNNIKIQVDCLTMEQREQFHQMLAKLLAEATFKRSEI